MTKDLVCAACAGPVSEGRCPTCRSVRMQHSGAPLTPELLILLVALLVAMFVVVNTVVG